MPTGILSARQGLGISQIIINYCIIIIVNACYNYIIGARGGAVVEALRYKPEGRGIHSRWCHWIFLLIESFRSHYGPGVELTSNRNEYQEYFLGVKAASA
jgi:hypothetical protein